MHFGNNSARQLIAMCGLDQACSCKKRCQYNLFHTVPFQCVVVSFTAGEMFPLRSDRLYLSDAHYCFRKNP